MWTDRFLPEICFPCLGRLKKCEYRKIKCLYTEILSFLHGKTRGKTKFKKQFRANARKHCVLERDAETFLQKCIGARLLRTLVANLEMRTTSQFLEGTKAKLPKVVPIGSFRAYSCSNQFTKNEIKKIYVENFISRRHQTKKLAKSASLWAFYRHDFLVTSRWTEGISHWASFGQVHAAGSCSPRSFYVFWSVGSDQFRNLI